MSNNQLTRIENEANFSTSELIIIKARQNVQIHIMNRSQLEFDLSKLLYQVYYYLGYKIDDREMTLLSTAVMNDLLLHYRWQTFQEIELAFNNGSRGEYGEFVGLNAARFNQWIKSFLSDRKRIDALEKEKRINQKIESGPSKEEIFRKSKKFALEAFETYKQKGFFEDFGNPVYDFLDSLGIIPFGKERKIEIFEQAKKKVKAKNNPAFAATSYDRDSFKKIMETIEQLGKEGNTLVKVEAKKIALDLFFAELIEMETELKDLIN